MKNISNNNKIILTVVSIICLYTLFSVKYSVQNLTYQKKYILQDLALEHQKLSRVRSNLMDLTTYSRIQDISSRHLEVVASQTHQIKSNPENLVNIIQMNKTFKKVSSNSWRYKKSIHHYIRALPKTNHVY